MLNAVDSVILQVDGQLGLAEHRQGGRSNGAFAVIHSVTADFGLTSWKCGLRRRGRQQ
jgi:hypothetical protein